MASFRGVDQVQIVDSLDKFFDFLLESNVGPLTAGAVAAWRAPGGLLEQMGKAQSAAEIEKLLREGGDRKDYTHMAFWMDCYFSSLLPAMDNKYCQAQRWNDVSKMRKLIGDVAAWGGFYMLGGRFHAMYPEDSEIATYKRDVLKCTDNEFFVSYRHDVFKGPFENYKAVFAVAVDFNKAAKAIEKLAADADMKDHIGYVGHNTGSLEMTITPQFAARVIDNAAKDIEDKDVVPVGLVQGARFIPLKPA